MPQISVNSANIIDFGFSATVDIYNRRIVFDTSTLSSYQGSSGSGIFNVQGIAFSLVDQDNVELMGVDWNNPQIVPSTDQEYTLDLSSYNRVFLFQSYKLTGYIKDADGTIYATKTIYKKVCQPVNINESGYVPGLFQLISDCINNTLTVKELTVLTYNNLLPESTSKEGTLSYPTGTIGAVSFTGTPFTNNVVYSGEYRIACTTIGTYNLGDDVYVLVTYLTNNVFSVACTSRIADLLCCIRDVQETAKKHCNDAIGMQAKQKLAEISPYLLTGVLSEMTGIDASEQADYIKKALNCNCGATSIHQNEMTPINPSVYNIVLRGVGGITIPSPTINGGTKEFVVSSSSYQVTKKDSGDTAFTITTDTSTSNTTKYLIAFDYNVMAGYILTAFEGDETYISRLQYLLVQAVNLSGLNGSCVIDTTTSNYTAQITGITAAELMSWITINGTNYLAPDNTHANDATAIQTWLNTLSLGVFSVTFNAGVLTITSASNTNAVSTIVYLKGGLSGTKSAILFQSSKWTLVQILQAIIDYLCGITALKVALGRILTLYQIDYNGDIQNTSFTTGQTQDDFNQGLADSIYNIVQRIDTLTGITCAKIKAIFVDRPNDEFGTDDRILGTLGGGNCAGLTDLQIALIVFGAVGKYSTVKDAFCAIDCDSPASCPDVADIALAMSGSNIGIYGLSWSTDTLASQTVTVKYKLSSSSTWIIATNSLLILANGNISGTTPYVILNPTAGATYDVQIVNNCGGAGFQKQITIPTGTVYSGSYYRENSLYLICGSTPVTLYSSAPFASGVTLYSNIGMTVPLTGYSYITLNGDNIYTLNPSTGVVGSDTGNACTSGTPALYRLGTVLSGVDDTGICSRPQVSLYTNGDFAVGGTLYLDVALTTPVTGYSYVLNLSNGTIYMLNSSTGAIGASIGLTCESS